jgi:hypothetical protein
MDNNNKNIHYCWQLLLHVQRLNKSGQQSGYAMLMTSIVSILVFSMLSVYLFSTNLYKSVATAAVDSGTTFYAAETGLNRRAYEVRQKFDTFGVPAGTAPAGANSALQMQTCINSNPISGVQSTNDFECRAQTIDYLESSLEEHSGGAAGNGVLIEKERVNNRKIKYRTYSFVNYLGQRVAKVPTGEAFAGLNMIENSYRVYTTSAKEADIGLTPKPVSAQTMLQMDFNDRWIPIFQFAAFYENDLEVNSGTDITISGPVHTNNNLRLAPGGLLTFTGRTTSAGDMYRSLGYKAVHGGTSLAGSPKTVRVTGGSGYGVAPNNYSQFSVSTAWNTTNMNDKFTASEITSTNGLFAPRAARLTIPPIASTDRTGIFFQKADVRVDFDPDNTTQPFRIKALGADLSPEVLRSLRQPVVFRAQNNAERNTVCQLSNPATVPGSVLDAWAQPRKDALLASMQAAIAREAVPIDYSSISTALSTLQTTRPTFYNNLITGFNVTTELPAIRAASMAQIAKLSASPSCIVPAPMQVIRNQKDRRENRDIHILLTNINSIVAWNRDGQFLTGGTLSGNAYTGGFLDSSGTANRFFNRLPAGGSNPNSYEALGLASADTTEGGLVWHFSINNVVDATAAINGYNYNTTNKTYGYRTGQSSFGFGISGAKRLPGALSIVSNQAVYTQGDYNFPNDPAPALNDQKPSAVMADTIAILSNQCLNSSAQLNCFNLGSATSLPVATSTTVNAAFLSRTDITDPSSPLNSFGMPSKDSGALNNYMRLMEDWANKTLRYRGSFVSMGEPLQFSGRWFTGASGANITNPALDFYYYYTAPIRDFGYDTSFDSVTGLPPLTPRANYLKQKVFRRDYNTSDRS